MYPMWKRPSVVVQSLSKANPSMASSIQFTKLYSYRRVWSYLDLQSPDNFAPQRSLLAFSGWGALGHVMSCLRFTIFVVWQSHGVPPPTVKLESMAHHWRGCCVKSSPVTWLESLRWIWWRTANSWCYISFHDLLIQDVTCIMTSSTIVFCQELIFGLLLCTLECARWQRGGTCALLLGTREASSEQLGQN